MRICLVSAALPDTACGIGDYSHNLATALVANGVEVVVVTTARPALRSELPYEVRPIATSWRFAETPRLARFMLRTGPDLIHIQFPGVGYGRGFAVNALPWTLLAARPRLPVALTLHEFDRMSGRHRLRVAAGALPCRLIVAPGACLARAAGRYLGWRPGLKVVDVPLASNVIPPLDGRAAADDFRRRPGELVVGYWGFLRPDKGVETLIEAFSKIRSIRPARLVLAGDPGPDLDYARSISSAIDRAGLREDTLVTGALPPDRLSATLLGFDVCVLPFRDGLTPNRGSYAAALAHGLPIVSTSLEEHGFDSRTNTYFVAPGDGPAIADAVLQAAGVGRLAWHPDVARDWASIADLHLGLYKQVLGR